jgi:protein TonB
MQRLKEKIESAWKYPLDAAARREYGDLYIQFTIKKKGKIGAVELIETSGHPSLDTAAIKALRDADPYWPLPNAMGKESLTITGHFVYLNGAYYIR